MLSGFDAAGFEIDRNELDAAILEAEAAAITEARESWRVWAVAALEGGAGPAHKVAKGDRAWVPSRTGSLGL